MIEFPAKINAAEDHFINGAPIGVFAIITGSMYALITKMDRLTLHSDQCKDQTYNCHLYIAVKL
ncbi:hypothetical protein BpHYR1_042348 [Brachionus plicatilis]|uniref:Uncharacterized protein n=1 Tax=Brachionus plicatilis TaxID=10195 RepID=A0A3M7SUW2_BRAPC|nr:hypothetical protein BpHYR1_042348 [Brachionus plicatilis]